MEILMSPPRAKSVILVLAALLLLQSASQAAVIFLYDFPNDPGDGLAGDQTNPQPTFATFSDFTRTNVNATGGPNFSSNNWSTGPIDTTQYVGFSITASPWYVLDLTSLTFDIKRQSNGPANGQVALFLNGSSIPYATFNFSPTTSVVTNTFDFTDLTNADMVTSATIRFYGWNAPGPGNLTFDNVVINGVVAAVPEVAPVWPIVALTACVGVEAARRRRSPARSPGRTSDAVGPDGLEPA